MNIRVTTELIRAALPSARFLGELPCSFDSVVLSLSEAKPGALWVYLGSANEQSIQMCRAVSFNGGIVFASSEHMVSGAHGVYVDKPVSALQALAFYKRRRIFGDFIAILGGNGKTTVTQMLGSILRGTGQSSRYHLTAGNQNNHIGVPLTLLNVPYGPTTTTAKFRCVIEIGMNHIGEVLPLAHMVSPTIALVNNAQREHLANLGSVKLTAIENGSVFRAVQYGGIAIYPSGDLFTPYWNRMARGLKKVRFSATGRAAVFGQRDKSGAFSIWQNSHLIRFRNPLLVGLHNVHNAVAAATVAMSTGIDHEQIRLGLESFIPPKGRLTHYSISHTDGCMILVDDTYNANPDSVEAALSLVATYAGKKLLIFGDMAECISPAETHRLVGEYAKRLGFHAVWSVGKFSRWSGLAFEKNSYHFENLSDAIASVSRLRGYDAILVKASRFMKLELLVEAIREDLAQSCSDRRAGA